MKKLSLVAFMLLTFSSFSFAADPVRTTIFGGLAADGYDTVAYWTENKAVEGKKKFTYEYKDADWRFASQANMDLFKADPQKYMPEYGAYCAWALSGDDLAGVDGEAWTIYEGKLYLNYNMNVMQDWRKQKALFVEQANGFYKKRFPDQEQSTRY